MFYVPDTDRQTASSRTHYVRGREKLRGVVRDKNVPGEGQSHKHAHACTLTHTCAHMQARAHSGEASLKSGPAAVAAAPQPTQHSLSSRRIYRIWFGDFASFPGGRATVTPQGSTGADTERAPSVQPGCPGAPPACARSSWARAVTPWAAREAWPRESVRSTGTLW